MVERETRIDRSAVGFGGMISGGDGYKRHIETKMCIGHYNECVLGVSW